MSDRAGFLDCPQMCLNWQGVDEETEIVRCKKGHFTKGDECLTGECPDYMPDGRDMNLLAADIMEIIEGAGRNMTDDELTIQAMLKHAGRRSPN